MGVGIRGWRGNGRKVVADLNANYRAATFDESKRCLD